MSNDPWGSDSDPFEDEGFVGVAAESDAAGNSFLKRYKAVFAISLVVVVAALSVWLSGSAGYAAVGLAAVAYLLAVMADLSARRSRHAMRIYRRPPVTAGLRAATFVSALWVGWLVAASLAGSG
ncbi:MAG: hypothetical protein OXF75_14070 [Acidimicrobiaceae bacterium]|nr:hypothetical protein [Acidimicrobiaceae bacterium]